MTKLKIDEKQFEMLIPIYKPTRKQIDLMLHAIGADSSPAKKYRDKYFYYAYRNGFDADGDDITEWDELVKIRIAEKDRVYHVTKFGIGVLELLTNSKIYLANCVGDAKPKVFRLLAFDEASCGYGNWIPTPAKSIATREKIPKNIVLECLHILASEGLITKTSYGEVDDEGIPHCWHGWCLTNKGKETDVYKKAYDEEMERWNNF